MTREAMEAMGVKILEQEPCEDWYDVPSNEMTLEQARQAARELRKKMAEYLDKEPCEDAISRQAVLDATVKKNSIWNSITNSKGENLEEIISQLPSVNLQEPKTGHWIDDEIGSKCSCCGIHIDRPMKFNYCPNCGERMIDEQESEDKE